MEYFQASEEGRSMIQDIELVAVSPLKRTLQTTEIGVLPHLSRSSSRTSTVSGDHSSGTSRVVPIVALPLASERVYLISDHGSSTSSLAKEFPFADFSREFHQFEDEWWFTVRDHSTSNSKEVQCQEREIHSFNSMHQEDYVEWRPNADGQAYTCFGEPDDAFYQRMISLYNWLEAREESVICLVCHWGVLDWLLGADFKNCEVQDVSFHKVRSKVMGLPAMMVDTNQS